MYDGNSRPAGFLADSTVFNQTTINTHRTLSYSDVSNINGVIVSTVDLLLNKEVEVIIAHPTLFMGYGTFLVFPGDKLSVSMDSMGSYVLKSLNKTTRTRELMAFDIFNEIAPPPPSLFYRDVSVDSIISSESKIKENILQCTNDAIYKFDSLRSVYKTSTKFNAVTKDYARVKYLFSLFRIYTNNKTCCAI
jgi:hypothetical protein